MTQQTNIAAREAEKIIVAALMQNRITAFETGLDGLEFANTDFRSIFLAVKDITQTGELVDLITLSNYLTINAAPQTVAPNPQVLANIVNHTELPTNLLPPLKILTANKARKRLKDLSESIEAWTNDHTDTPLEIVERAESQLETIRQTLGLRATNRRHISEITPIVKQVYQELYEGLSFNLPTGIETIDRVTGGGGAPGEVWVVGAFTGQGKSALALQMAENQSAHGITSLVISREMLDIENFKRVHANIADIPLWTVKPKMPESTFKRLNDTIDDVSKQKIYIDSTSSDIHTVCRELKDFAKNDDGRVAYIDYLQLLEGMPGKQMNRTEEIAYCSKMLKKTAMDTGLWIVALAQYNRQANYAGTAENHSFDGSSQIEKDASVVMHLELEKVEMKPGIAPPKWRKATIRMTKARNSAHTAADLWFRGETFTFADENPEYAEETDIRFR